MKRYITDKISADTPNYKRITLIFLLDLINKRGGKKITPDDIALTKNLLPFSLLSLVLTFHKFD